MKGNRLYKKEKLCGLKTIDSLFKPGVCPGLNHYTGMAYPWRAVWTFSQDRTDKCTRFLISVPKKRLRHAVDRVLMRRRCREAYRLSRLNIIGENMGADIAFIYVADKTTSYRRTFESMKKLLSKINAPSATKNNEDTEYKPNN